MRFWNLKALFLILFLIPNLCIGDSELTVNGRTAAAHLIKVSGTLMPPRAYLEITGDSVVGTDVNGETVVTIPNGLPVVGPTILAANVGIGSSNPGQALDVNGTVRAISFIGDGSQLTGIMASNYWIKNGAIGIGTSGTNSNVGIGTIAPTSVLTVQGSSSPLIVINQVGGAISSNIVQNLGSANEVVGEISNITQNQGQSFTITQNTVITGGSVSFGPTNGSPPGTIGMNIYTTSGGNPTTSLANANATISITPVASTNNFFTYATSFTLTPGVYFLGFICSNFLNNNYWTVQDTNTNPYAGGQEFTNDNNSGWVATPTADFNFSILGNIPSNVPQLQFQSGGTSKGYIQTNDSDASNLEFGTGSTQMVITTAGNIGIGSLTPGQVLDVNGNIRTLGTNQHIFGSDNTNSIQSSASTSGDMKFNTNSLERMRITNGGNIGIGTTTPQGGLVVTKGNVGIGTWAPGNIFQVGTNTLVATGGGNVGIGVTTPSALFHIASASGTQGFLLEQVNTAQPQWAAIGHNGTGSGNQIEFGISGGTNQFFIGTAQGDMVLKAYSQANTGSLFIGATNGNSTGMVFIPSGNVGIGSIAPGQTLDVQGTIRFSGKLLQTSSAVGIGWSEHNATNQACNTTCGSSACVIGLDIGTVGVINSGFVACTDATADDCLCAGP